MQSSIFLRNITCLDHAYIDNQGLVHGMSYHISATVTGKVESEESVVVDFSRCKKLLKSYIDDPIMGFDHKLLIYPNSKVEFLPRYDNPDELHIVTPYFTTICPRDSIRVLEGKHELSEYLTEKLQEDFPDLDITVTTHAREDGFTEFGTYFRYSHGLKNSSSWGCQNQNHGHLSFVEVLKHKDDGSIHGDSELQRIIADYLDETVFINHENVIYADPGVIVIQYKSKGRGVFTSTYQTPIKWKILKSETTIEYIIEHVREKFIDELHGHTLRISEGLAKGAEIYVD